MLDPRFEKQYILIKIPQKYQKIIRIISTKAEELGFEVMQIEQYDTCLPSHIRGAFVYNDGTFETGLLCSYIREHIHKLFILTDDAISLHHPGVVVCSSLYTKISESIDAYLTDIQKQPYDFLLDKTCEGFRYTTSGDMKINPYPGLLISFDNPNIYKKLVHGGHVLINAVVQRLAEQDIPVVEEYFPSRQVIGGTITSGLKNELDIETDALQLLFLVDRITAAKKIYKQLEQGAIVITNSYVLSNLAYAYKDIPMGFILAGNAQVYLPDIDFVTTYKSQEEVYRATERTKTNALIFDHETKQKNVNEAFKDITDMFTGITHSLEAEKSVEELAKKAVRIIKNHPKFQGYT